jgi:hypothetical protein
MTIDVRRFCQSRARGIILSKPLVVVSFWTLFAAPIEDVDVNLLAPHTVQTCNRQCGQSCTSLCQRVGYFNRLADG